MVNELMGSGGVRMGEGRDERWEREGPNEKLIEKNANEDEYLSKTATRILHNKYSWSRRDIG